MPPLLAALPAIASVASIGSTVAGAFGGDNKQGGETVETTPSWLTALQRQLAGTVSKGLEGYTPGEAYKGKYTADATSQENTTLSMLTKLLGESGTGGLFDQASGHVSDTLAGKFADPASSPFIQAMSKLARNNLDDSITQERGMRGSRGTYFTDAGIQAEGKLRTRSQDSLNAIIGQFVQQERQNQLGAVPLAANLDQYKNLTLPLEKIKAGQSYGSLSRLIEQSNLESQYQDYLRQRTELSGNADRALKLAVNQDSITPGTMQTPVTDNPNSMSNILALVSKLAPQVGSIFK